MHDSYDLFARVREASLPRAQELLEEWFPRGIISGHEYMIGGIDGAQGKSLKINLLSGEWSDFANQTLKGGDLTALRAAIDGSSQIEAAKKLAERLGIAEKNTWTMPAGGIGQIGAMAVRSGARGAQASEPPDVTVAGSVREWGTPPPEGAPKPSMIHSTLGAPSNSWAYHTADGHIAYYVARYNTVDPDGKPEKEIRPWSWDSSKTDWVQKGWSEPRLLYNLHLFASHPDWPVLLVEGEGCAEAGTFLLGATHICTTWPNGSGATDKVDLTPLVGHTILEWPDADRKLDKKTGVVKPYAEQPGPQAMFNIAAKLAGKATVSIINVGIDPQRQDGWDVGNAVSEGMDASRFWEWSKPLTSPAAQAAGEEPPAPVDHAADLKAAVGVLREEWESGDSDRKIVLLAAVMLPMIRVDGARQEVIFAELAEATGWNRGALNNVYHAAKKQKEADDKASRPKRAYKPLGEEYFELLGYDYDGMYYYLPNLTHGGHIVKLSASGHNSSDLNRVAPWEYWERQFGREDDEKGVSWPMVTAALIEEQHRVGFLNQNRIHGQGTWFNKKIGKVVINTGDKILVKESTRWAAYPTGKFGDDIYTAGPPLSISISETSLAVEESRKFVELCGSLPFMNGVTDSRLFAGWIVCAVIGGALEWRPHLWLTGERGSGKSYILEQIAKRILGNWAVGVSGSSSEAGIRQSLGYDARPVIVDEFESSSVAGGKRIATIVEFARQASGGVEIVKGGSDGKARKFNAQSSFMFSSIHVSLTESADTSRITILEVVADKSAPPDEKQTRFERLKEAVAHDLGGDYAERLRTRAISMVEVIRTNAETFAQAVTSQMGERRHGDQLGTLLAGAYSLISDGPIAYADALKIVLEQNLEEHKENAERSDSVNVLDMILQAVVKVPAKSGFSTMMVDRSVSDLILISPDATNDVTHDDAQQALRLIGIRRDADRFVIADRHREIAKLMAGTKFEGGGWGPLLARLPGARRLNSVRFGSAKGRAVSLPVDMVA